MRTALLAVLFFVLFNVTLFGASTGRFAFASEKASDADHEAVKKAGERFAKNPKLASATKDILGAAEKSPTDVIGCSIDDSQTINASYAVCLSVMSVVSNSAVKPDSALRLLQGCTAMPAARCYAMVDELQDLLDNVGSKAKPALVEQCADRTEKAFPGNARAQYVQACQDLADYLK